MTNDAKIGALLEDGPRHSRKACQSWIHVFILLTIHHGIIKYSVCNFYSLNGLMGALQASSGPNVDDHFMRALNSTKYREHLFASGWRKQVL